MTPEDIKTRGEALFGPLWQTPLAAALGMNRTTVHRYATGALPIPPKVALALSALEAGR